MLVDPLILRFIFALAWSFAVYGGYYLLFHRKPTDSLRETNDQNYRSGILKVLLRRMMGFLLLGILTALLVRLIFMESLRVFGAGILFRESPPLWIYPLLLLIPPAAFLNAASPVNLALYPQIRIHTWTPTILVFSSITWIIYLIGYEFFFRGFLLYAALIVMAPWQAIAINTSLYAVAHLYKGKIETFGSIPLGILLCYITIRTGNIWSAVVLHSVMALSNEWFSIRAHPEMKVRK